MDNYTDLELLAELIRRNKARAVGCPVSRAYGDDCVEMCIGIGPDHYADITLHTEAVAEAERLTMS